jgi:hypothetical protein
VGDGGVASLEALRLRMPNGDADFQRVCEIDLLRDG